MIVHIEIGDKSALESAAVTANLEKIAKNFNSKNIAEMGKLSEIPNANTRIEKLFGNPLFKAALK